MRHRLLILSLTALCISGCSGKGTGPREGENLLANGSFERNDQPTLDGWTPQMAELVQIVEGAPAGGGKYALRLAADWTPTLGYVTATVPGLHGGDVISLSAYMRAVGPNGGGTMSLLTGPSRPQPSTQKSITTYDTAWTRLTVTGTLSLTSGDSVWVMLSSLNTEIAQRVCLFDLVELVRRGEPAE